MREQPTSSAPKRKRRTFSFMVVSALVIFAVLAAGVGLGIPFWLNSPSGWNWLLAQANRVLAPARLEVGTFRWSWFGSTRLTRFVIRDKAGGAVISAPEALWDRTLWQAITQRPRYGTLRLPGAALDIDRSADGSIDLVEALEPILGRDPRASFVIRIEGGRLRARSPELAEPIAGRDLDLVIDRQTEPNPTTWRLTMAGEPAASNAYMKISGSVDRGGRKQPGAADLDLDLQLVEWPLSVRIGDDQSRVSTRLDTSLHVARRNYLWETSGTAKAIGSDVISTALIDESVRIDTVNASWNATRTGGGWSFEQLNVNGAGVRLEARGHLPAAGEHRFEAHGQVDLAELARRIPRTLRLREGLTLDRGELDIDVTTTAAAGKRDTDWEVRSRVSDLEASEGERRLRIDQPASVEALVRQGDSGFSVERFLVESSALRVEGHGDLDSGIDLNGSIDLVAFGEQFQDLIALPREGLSGSGTFQVRYEREQGTYTARVKADLKELGLGIQRRDDRRPDARVQEQEPVPVHLEASIAGPAAQSGWPEGWRTVEAKLEGSDGNATLSAVSGTDGLKEFLLDGKTRLVGSQRPLLADVHIEGKQERASFLFSEFRFALQTEADPFGVRPVSSIALRATGSYDQAADVLRLTPTNQGNDEQTGLRLAKEGVRVEGIRSGSWTAEGGIEGDLAGLETLAAAMMDHTPLGLEGAWEAKGSLGANEGKTVLRATLDSADVALWRGEDRQSLGPVSVRLDATHQRGSNEIGFTQISAETCLGTLHATGSVNKTGSTRHLTASGSFEPDWDEINQLLRERVEPNASIAGGSLVFQANGSLEGDTLARLDVAGSLDVEALDIYGMRVDATPVSFRAREGKFEIAPIETTLNGGTLVLKPELSRDEDGRWLAGLREGSFIENADVNEEVSHRVLAYVAPVLDGATRMSGQVSARFDKAQIPLTGSAREHAVVEGAVVFHDVAFTPGPMALQMYDLLGMEPLTITLNEPVVLSIYGGKVHQRGFSIPLGSLARVEMEGTVGFDRSLDVVVNLPLASERFVNVPVFNSIAPALRVTVPIRGTLDEPRVDGKAMARSMGEMGLDVARGAGLGSIEALARALNQPRDPEEEARLQAEREERQRLRREEQARKKAERIQKREDRRLRRARGS